MFNGPHRMCLRTEAEKLNIFIGKHLPLWLLKADTFR